jgi:hypothetical protein
VAWIRRARTASGATAVQIAEYDAGRRKIVAHVGSAHTEAELGILIERAREMLTDPAQGTFDLGIEPAVPRARLVAPPPRHPAGAIQAQSLNGYLVQMSCTDLSSVSEQQQENHDRDQHHHDEGGALVVVVIHGCRNRAKRSL